MIKSLISLEEFKFMGPRLFVYAGIAYAATRVVKFGINQTGRLLGLTEDR